MISDSTRSSRRSRWSPLAVLQPWTASSLHRRFLLPRHILLASPSLETSSSAESLLAGMMNTSDSSGDLKLTLLLDTLLFWLLTDAAPR
jgi:hypothetical protein